MTKLRLLDQIRNELVESNHLFSNTLRKALVLSSRVHSDSLRSWVKGELNGYRETDILPTYRIIGARSFSNYHTYSKVSINQFSRVPVSLDFEYAHRASVTDGVSSLEDIILKAEKQSNSVVQLDWSPPMFNALSSIHAKQGAQLIKVWKEISPSDIVQVVDSAKNRLLDFVLELENLAESSGSEIGNVQSADVDYLVDNLILNNSQLVMKGVKTMTVFDQRGQNVNYQYNAAGNINFGSVNNRFEVVEHLRKLQDEVAIVVASGQLDEDTATDVEYQMKKAVQQAAKENPEKKTIVEHLSNAKGLIAGVASLAGLVTGISEAIKAVQGFFS